MDDERRHDAARRPLIGVGAVVWRDGKVLLVRRAKAPRRGMWAIPGGRQELGETVFAAAEREVREETGVEARVTGLLDVIDSIDRDGDGTLRFHYTLIDVAAEWLAGDPRPADDVDRALWADPSDLARFDLWEETARIISLSAARRAAGSR